MTNKVHIPNRYCILKKDAIRYMNCLDCKKHLNLFNKCIEDMKKHTLYKIPNYIQNDPDNFELFFDELNLEWIYYKK